MAEVMFHKVLSEIVGPNEVRPIKVKGPEQLKELLDHLKHESNVVYIHYIFGDKEPFRESLIKIIPNQSGLPDILFNNLRGFPATDENEKDLFATKLLDTTRDSIEFQNHFFDTFQYKKQGHQINANITMGITGRTPIEEAFYLFDEKLINVANAKALSSQYQRFFNHEAEQVSETLNETSKEQVDQGPSKIQKI